MANSYCAFSCILPVPKDKQDRLAELIKEKEEAIVHMDEYIGCKAEILEDGVWFTDVDWNGEPEHVAEIAEHIINALQLSQPFYCSYAYWCDKPRLDEFGGGAFRVELGRETVWCNPEQFLRDNVRLRELLSPPISTVTDTVVTMKI